MTKRREFIQKSSLATVAGITSLGLIKAPAIAKNIVSLKMLMSWPRGFWGFGTSAERLANRINKMSSGQIEVSLTASNEGIEASKVFDAVSQGEADLFHSVAYIWQDKSSIFNYFTTIPFGMSSSEMNAWLMYGGGKELWREVSKEFNLIPFMSGNTGMQMGGWYHKPLNSVDDLKGLSLRISGIGAEVFNRLGAQAGSIPAPQIIPKMKSGELDGAEFIGPWIDHKIGLHKTASNYYYPAFHEPTAPSFVAFNQSKWNSLSDENRNIIANAILAECDFSCAEFLMKNAHSLNELRDKVSIKGYPSDILKKTRSVSQEVFNEFGHQSKLHKKVYESYSNFMKNNSKWMNISESAFYQARSL